MIDFYLLILMAMENLVRRDSRWSRNLGLTSDLLQNVQRHRIAAQA